MPKASKVIYLNCYSVSRHYGGPEEGGWWYDSGELLASVPLEANEDGEVSDEVVETVKTQLTALIGWPIGPTRIGRHSVIGGSDFEIYVEDEVGHNWPTETPHYE